MIETPATLKPIVDVPFLRMTYHHHHHQTTSTLVRCMGGHLGVDLGSGRECFRRYWQAYNDDTTRMDDWADQVAGAFGVNANVFDGGPRALSLGPDYECW